MNSVKQTKKLQHVDSLLLPKLNAPRFQYLSSCKASSLDDESSKRQSPVRRAKNRTKYNFSASCSDESSYESSNDEFQLENDSETDETSFDHDEFWTFKSQSSLQTQNASQMSKITSSIEIVDLTEEKENFVGINAKSSDTGSLVSRSRGVSLSSNDDSNAILRFSPPRTKTPWKKPPISRMKTPPQSPVKSTLSSPTKPSRIPATPHRPSLEAFWDAGLVNSWNDKHSPHRNFQSPRKMGPQQFSRDISPLSTPKQAQKNVSKAGKAQFKAARKAFEQSKHEIARNFLEELDSQITQGEIGALAASTGGVKLIWSKTLKSTAGRAHWRREVKAMCSPSKPNLNISEERFEQEKATAKHHASIELAEKVIDSETRLYNTLAHEFCHLANFMISGVKDQPHGASFKRWGRLVSDTYAERGVEVTTKHTYQIEYKYAWICSNNDCRAEYERQSRSIDPKRHGCGKCKSKLVQIKPIPRAGKNGDGHTSGLSEYQLYVRQNYSIVKDKLGEKSPMKDVMKEIGLRYRLQKHDKSKPHQQEVSTVDQQLSIPMIDLTLDEDDLDENQELFDKETNASGIDTVSRLLNFLYLKDA